MTTIQLIGAPGSGKSTVASILSKLLDMPLFVEPFEQNEFIPMLAQGLPVYYECEARMLELTTSQEAIASATHDGAILDGGRLQTMGFIRHFLSDKKLKQWEFKSLAATFDESRKTLKLPDFVFMLQAPPKVIKKRIQHRGRDFEQGYTTHFLCSLQDSIFVESTFMRRIMIDSNRDVLDVVGNIIDILQQEVDNAG